MDVSVAANCELGTAQLDPTLGPADGYVRAAHQGLGPGRHPVAATSENDLPGLAVANRILDPSHDPTLRCHYVQEREPWVVDRASGRDQLFCPGYRLIILDAEAEPSRICGDGGGIVEVAVVGSPPECGAQVRQLDCEPVIGVALAWAVPQSHDVSLALREVACMRGPDLLGHTTGGELLLGELADRLQHRKPGPPRRPVSDHQRLAHQRVEQIQGGEVIIGTHDRAGALEVESPANTEHRSS